MSEQLDLMERAIAELSDTVLELRAQMRAAEYAFMFLLAAFPLDVIDSMVAGLRKMETELRLRNHDDHEVAAIRKLADLLAKHETRP
jgi:hypothetical protein